MTHMRLVSVRSKPPPTEDDATTRKHCALIRPEVIVIRVIVVLAKVLHEGDALPARDATLRRQRVEPAESLVVVFQIFATAFELNALNGLGCVAALGPDALFARIVAKRA